MSAKNLANRPLVDSRGRPIHDCPAAIPLSRARTALVKISGGRSVWERINPYSPTLLSWQADAITSYLEAAIVRGACQDCREEASAGNAELRRLLP